MSVNTAACIFTLLTCVVIIFQACLAAGLPWGKASMGGKYPGKYPAKMRLVAIINMLVLTLFICIVLAKAGVFLSEYDQVSEIGIWIVVAFFTLGTVLNIITPSKIERIWAPVAFVQTISALYVALH